MRNVVANGWLWGADPENPNRVRFARPFQTAFALTGNSPATFTVRRLDS